MKDKTPLLHYFVAFRCNHYATKLQPKYSIIFVRNYPLSYFRGSRYSQCFILSTSLHCSSYQGTFYANNYYQYSNQCPLSYVCFNILLRLYATQKTASSPHTLSVRLHDGCAKSCNHKNNLQSSARRHLGSSCPS